MKKTVTAILCLFMFLIVTLTACDDVHPATNSQDETGSGTSSMQESVQESAQEPVPETYGIGDSAVLGDWNITLDAFEFMDKVDGDYSMYVSPDEGCQFGVVSLSVINNGTGANRFLPTYALSQDVKAKILCGEYEFSSTNLLAISNDLHDETLNPLVAVSGIIAFNIPQSIVDGSEPLTLTLYMGNDTLEFALR